ncbi:MAG: CZB domain-containing protein [Gammaproteobacteria bacterium]|nr:CZB domain-containing protein [Gammaproteobacteria bacterium]
MGFFSKLFGHNAGNEAKMREAIRSEISIPEAIDVHMRWKGRLQSYVDGTSKEQLDPMVICRDDQCDLGKWILGPALQYFHDDEGFEKLRSDHANFHFVAGSVVMKVKDNDLAASEALLNNEYARASRDVIQDLTELNKLLRQEE